MVPMFTNNNQNLKIESFLLQAWLQLIALAKKDLILVSQWGIGRSGRGLEIYNKLKEGKVISKLPKQIT